MFRVYLAVGVLAAVLHPLRRLVGDDGVWYPLVVAWGVGAGFVGLWLHRPENRLAWWLFLGARIAILVGVLSVHQVQPSTFIGSYGIAVSDFFYTLSFAFFFLFIFFLCRPGFRLREWNGLIDGLAVLLGLSIIAWKLTVLPTLAEIARSTNTEIFLRMLYPMACFVVLGGLVWSSTFLSTKSASFRFLVLGTMLYAIGTVMFHLVGRSVALPRAYVLVMWLLSYVFWGAAALHPSAKTAAVAVDTTPSRYNGRLRLLAASTLALPLVSVVQSGGTWSIDLMVTVVISLMMAALISARVANLVQDLQHQARTDYLSNVANRRHLKERFDALTSPPGSAAARCGLIVVDLDRFKSVNESLGAPAGDALIRAFAARLRDATTSNDVLSRLGGDEFAILVKCNRREDAVARAWQLQEALNKPFEVAEYGQLRIAASMGVAIYPNDGDSFTQMLKASDAAMRGAKRRLSRVESYNAESMGGAARTSLLLTDVSSAIRNRQLVPYFQPKVDLITSRVIGVEALVRWLHPTQGVIMPGHFVPQIEETELIRDLTNSMLTQCLEQCVQWRAAGIFMPIAVNVSTRNLSDPRFVADVEQMLARGQLGPEWLEIEITESSALGEAARVNAVVRQLRDLGVRLSIDDFGTGFGSLAYLQDLPVHCIKLERRFICDICSSQSSELIVRHSVELARQLSVDVVAEGVEDVATQSALVNLGCSKAQGYFYARPMPALQIMSEIDRIETELRLTRRGPLVQVNRPGAANVFPIAQSA